MIVKNDLYDYKNRYIFQDSEGFKFSLDSILLAEFSRNVLTKNVLDLCTGNAAIPLIASTFNSSKYVGFEIQKEVYDLAVKSVEFNGLNDRIKIINDDINNISKYYSKSFFDIITCNPPFFKTNDISKTNKNKLKACARHEIYFSLEDAFKISKEYLKEGGALYLVHRIERLDEICILANKYDLNVKKIQLVTTKSGKKPSILLVKCVKNSKMGLVINKEICIENIKSYQNLFEEK